MELTERQRKYLRGLGHALNPVLLVGQHGMTPAVIAEAERALHDHELIKVKFRGAEREARDAGLSELATATGSILVQRIGHTALYYKRRNDRPGIVIPDAERAVSAGRSSLTGRGSPDGSNCRTSSGKSLE